MTRIAIVLVLSGALAAFALPANIASAGTVTIHTATPPKFTLPPPKVPIKGGTTTVGAGTAFQFAKPTMQGKEEQYHTNGASNNVGIFKLTPDKVEAGSENIKRTKTYTRCTACVSGPR